MNVVCKNIKIRILLENPFDLTKQTNGSSVVNKRNLLIVRSSHSKCVFIVYKHTLSTIHITGISTSNAVNEILEFLNHFHLTEIKKLIIDNSLFSGKTNNNIDIVEMKKRLDEKYNFYSISFSQDVFPAIFIRPVLNRKRDYATILLFRNSKFIIIGSRSVQIMNNTLEVVKDLTC